MLALVLALVLFVAGNALGTALLKTGGFGLISFSRSTSAAGWWRAPLARLSGPLLIYLFAVATFAVVYLYSEFLTSQVQVAPGFPAEAAGLRTGDRVVEMDGAPVSTFPDVIERVREAAPGKPVEMVVLRGDQRLTAKVVTDDKGHVGVRPFGELVERSWGAAIAGSLRMPFRAVVRWLNTLWAIAAGEQQMELMRGPIALVQGDSSPRTTQLLWPLAVQASCFGSLLALVALASQVVAWARGELRAPTPGGG